MKTPEAALALLIVNGKVVSFAVLVKGAVVATLEVGQVIEAAKQAQTSA